MPALPPVPNVLKIEFKGQQSGQAFVTIKHWRYSGSAPSNTAALAIATAAHAALATGDTTHEIHTLLGNDTAYTSTKVTDLSSDTGGVGEYSSNIQGTRGSAVLPASAAVLESMGADRRYRGGHARTYWPMGIQTDLTDVRTWGSTFLTNIGSFLGGFYTGMDIISSGGCTLVAPVVVHYIKNKARLDTPLVDDLVSKAVHAVLCSQRRRLVG